MTDAERIISTFKRFDADNNGIIERNDLLRVLAKLEPGKVDESIIDDMLGSMDKNGDGKINYNEFVEWIMESESKEQPVAGRALSFDPKSFLPNQFDVMIESRYKLNADAVGAGGYGTVFLAWDKRSNRKVAVKRVTKTKTDPKQKEALYREISLMKELDHPNICKLFETFETSTHIFYVMECCEGGEVFDRIIETGQISEAITVEIIRQLTAAVRYAHGRKICHRDLKPENLVFLTREKDDNRVKLIDWGLATSFDGSLMRSAVGSMTYTAPEVMTALDVTSYTEACDLWSLGVVAYVMLAGKPPFWGGEANQLRCARAEKYPLDYEPWPRISSEAKDFIAKLLKANPALRMSVTECSEHSWLAMNNFVEDPEAQRQALENMKRFSNTGLFTAMCIASVARQLDHTRLKDIHAVFRKMDKNADGYLSIDEVQEGFRNMYGESSPEFRDITSTFKGLDLDASGIIDYTEFCASAMDQKTAVQEESIWAAFKTFDVDNTDTITLGELKRVLESADVKKMWTPEVCEQVAAKMLSKHDNDADGVINYEEWMALMKQVWAENLPTDATSDAPDISKVETPQSRVYNLLLSVSDLPAVA